MKEISPSWCSLKGRVTYYHHDAMVWQNVRTRLTSKPCTHRFDLTCYASVLSSSALVTTHEMGMGLKNSGSVFEGILQKRIFNCKDK